MKILNNKIFYFLLGILVSGIIVYAETRIQASQIEYNNTTVESALNGLYSINNQDLIDRIDSTISYNATYGSKANGTNTSLNLSAGNYIIVGIDEYTSPITTYADGGQGSTSSSAIEITTTSGTCEKISSKFTRSVPTNTFDSTSKYLRNFMFVFTWKCKLSQAATVTITDTSQGTNDNTNYGSISIQAIKTE